LKQARPAVKRPKSQPVDPLGVSVEEGVLLALREVRRDTLEGIPERHVPDGLFVDWEVALEHAALYPEAL